MADTKWRKEVRTMAECEFKKYNGDCRRYNLISMPKEINKVEITNNSVKINGTQINYASGLTLKVTPGEYPGVTLSFTYPVPQAARPY